tara:strand:- start:451 stop:672 length:222 start_codon:yes stop_codon:yes gene_type:complete
MFLDLTKDKCPITFVKIKIALEKLAQNKELSVKIKKGEELDNMQGGLKELGYKIISKKKLTENIFIITVKSCG